MIKKAVKNVLWALIPISMGIFFMALIWGGVERIVKGEHIPKERSSFISKIKNIQFKGKEEDNSVATAFKFDNITYPPQPEYFIKDPNKTLKIGSIAYVVGDVDTGEIILEKNADSVFPIASVTKLMTALVSLETLDQNAETKVSNKAVSTLSSRGELRSGEKVTISDLLYPLLLVSSNDAAEVLAEVPGRNIFMEEMNHFAKEIGMEKTAYQDPSGLSEHNKSTAKDLFRLSTYLQNNHRVVFDVTALTKYTAIGKVWNNISTFSRNENYIGGKTGYTDKAKRTGVGLFSVAFENYDNRNIAIILLRTDDRTKDTYSILNYIRENVTYGYEEEIRDQIKTAVSDGGGSVLGETLAKSKKKKEDSQITNIETINNCPKPSQKFEEDAMFNASPENSLPENYTPEHLTQIKGGVETKGRMLCLDKDTNEALEKMAKDMEKEGLEIVPTSAFRSFETQKYLFDEWHKDEDNIGDEEAVAKPGHSEHQLGTTVDVSAPGVGYDSAHRGFYLTREYKWLDSNAHKYGFVMSYPANKKTGYIFEPWHWRYVGIEDAYHIKLANITIQEFLSNTPEEKGLFKSNPEVTISFLGDIMMDRGVKTSVYKNFEGDFNKLFENLGELKEDDITFANLEGPVSDVGNNVGSKYSFRMEEKSLEALQNASFDIVSFANNHVGDWNVAAFNDTRTNLDGNGIKYVGAGSNKEKASEVKIIEKNGLKIGFLAFTDVGPNWMEAGTEKSGILLASDPKRLEYIKTAKEKVDALVVSYHWGEEYKAFNARQKSLAESSIDAGASIVVGHHPHVMQDTVPYNNGLIIYSLGNAIFDQYFSDETMKGGLVTATLTKEGLKDYEEKYFILDKNFVPGVPVEKM
ncbi:MAG: cap protein [Patescibacteria group bacterium]|jgi:poly-gamma-glutamate synthesis protein (capsule biosynthesis protein)|nr:cap protein [Patescibacteria group bacterium]